MASGFLSEKDSAQQSGKVVRIAASELHSLAVLDLWQGLKRRELWWNFALHDTKQRFRRSTLGPFWITLSMGVMVIALGLVFGKLLNHPINDFLPYLATGLIFWGLLTAIINDSCMAFIAGEGYIRNVPMPLIVHFYRMFARNIIIWLHNMVIYIIVFFIFKHHLTVEYLYFIPGFLLFIVNLLWIGLAISLLSTRFRDIPQVIANLLQVAFMVTPIFWTIDSLPNRPAFIRWNPLYHLIEIVRSPLLGEAAPAASWIMMTAFAVIGVPLTIVLYRRAYARIPYWV